MMEESLKNVATCDLVNALKNREGTQSIFVPPYEPFELKINNEHFKTEITDGCCHIIIVWD